ncbi:MAG: hypothetical protein QXI12_11650, partial [Candidatus Methanomethyliaceae archaeon]
YRLAITVEGIMPPGDPCYVRVPREMEEKAYVWPEYAKGVESEESGEAPKYVAGDMYFVRFGRKSGDPIWTVDILSSQSGNAQEIFGYLMADALNGFPIPLYPLCLQKAHEYAEVVDFDLDILQDTIYEGIRSFLPRNKQYIVDGMRLSGDTSRRRYE